MSFVRLIMLKLSIRESLPTPPRKYSSEKYIEALVSANN